MNNALQHEEQSTIWKHFESYFPHLGIPVATKEGSKHTLIFEPSLTLIIDFNVLDYSNNVVYYTCYYHDVHQTGNLLNSNDLDDLSKIFDLYLTLAQPRRCF